MHRIPVVLVFSGSNREESLNSKIADYAFEYLQKSDLGVKYLKLSDYPLPLYGAYDPNLEKSQTCLKELTDIFRTSDAFFIASPEHNGFFTPMIKNTLDWISKDDISVFTDKPVSLASASPGYLGGIRGLNNLRQLLGMLGFLVMGEQFAIPRASYDMLLGEMGSGNRKKIEHLLNKLVEQTCRMQIKEPMKLLRKNSTNL